jgi:DNA-directed RNA polymerase subunit RPC12/RpoP
VTRAVTFLAAFAGLVTALGAGINWIHDHGGDEVFAYVAWSTLAVVPWVWFELWRRGGPTRFGVYWLVLFGIEVILVVVVALAADWFPSLGYIVAGIALLPTTIERYRSDRASRRKCPDCREEIRADANVCKHCGFRLVAKPQIGDAAGGQ